jgi:hypothetical protein
MRGKWRATARSATRAASVPFDPSARALPELERRLVRDGALEARARRLHRDVAVEEDAERGDVQGRRDGHSSVERLDVRQGPEVHALEDALERRRLALEERVRLGARAGADERRVHRPEVPALGRDDGEVHAERFLPRRRRARHGQVDELASPRRGVHARERRRHSEMLPSAKKKGSKKALARKIGPKTPEEEKTRKRGGPNMPLGEGVFFFTRARAAPARRGARRSRP